MSEGYDGNFFRRLEADLLDRDGLSGKVPPKKDDGDVGVVQAMRGFFGPKKARYFHGSRLEDVFQRLEDSLKPWEEGSISPRYYETGTVFWRGETRWSARRATKAFFEAVVNSLVG